MQLERVLSIGVFYITAFLMYSDGKSPYPQIWLLYGLVVLSFALFLYVSLPWYTLLHILVTSYLYMIHVKRIIIYIYIYTWFKGLSFLAMYFLPFPCFSCSNLSPSDVQIKRRGSRPKIVTELSWVRFHEPGNSRMMGGNLGLTPHQFMVIWIDPCVYWFVNCL